MEVDSIASLLSLCEAGDCIFLDIDETLLHSEPHASEPWAKRFSDELQLGGVKSENAWSSSCHIWAGLQGVCEVGTCEEVTCSTLLELQRRGHTMVGLTARGRDSEEETVAQLKRCGLGTIFSGESLGWLSAGRVGFSKQPIWHGNGIIFCSGNPKPEGLLAFERRSREGCQDSQQARERVVFLDDKLHHVQDMAACFNERGRRFVGLHYRHASLHSGEDYELPAPFALVGRLLATQRGRSHLKAAIAALDETTAEGGHCISNAVWVAALAASFFAGIATATATFRLCRSLR